MSADVATQVGPVEDESQEAGLPVVGDVIDGRYRVERILGSGGMGIVVAARSLALDIPVAIKFLRPSIAKNNDSIERFKMEARASMRIQSEHVARVQDVATLPIGTPYMLMEYLEGEDLGQVIERGGVISMTAAVDFILEACEALAEAHALGIVHRDLKPANLFLAKRPDGAICVKVLDFGISKAMNTDGQQNPNMTDTRATFGSPTYMSPEQIRSSKRVDFRTDVWALGVCLHEIIARRPPFEAETVAGLLASIIADPAVPLRKHRPDTPPGLEEVVLRCLEKDLSRRYQSIAELCLALQPFASRLSMTSIERVMRISGPVSASRIESIRSPSGSYAAVKSSPALVHARTEQSFSTSNSVAAPVDPASRRQTKVLVAVAALMTVTLGVAGVTFMLRRHPAAGGDTATNGTALVPQPPTTMTAAMTTTAPSASSLVIAEIVPSASAAPSASALASGAPVVPPPAPGTAPVTAPVTATGTAAGAATGPNAGRHPPVTTPPKPTAGTPPPTTAAPPPPTATAEPPPTPKPKPTGDSLNSQF